MNERVNAGDQCMDGGPVGEIILHHAKSVNDMDVQLRSNTKQQHPCRIEEQGLVLFANFFNPMNSTTFVLFDKYYSIVDQLGSKDSSHDFQLNCVISYFFYLHLILHASG